MIKVGLSLFEGVTPLLFRLLSKHPDVDVIWIGSDASFSAPDDFFRAVEGELGDTVVVSESVEPDFSAIDLYIGPHNKYVAEYFSENSEFKTIMPDWGEIDGVCELNRKLMVRGGRSVILPSLQTLICAIALMPLAKNLMLNAPVTGTLLRPVGEHAGSQFVLRDRAHTSSLEVLTGTILPSLQNSFSSPVVVSEIETPADDFACAVLTAELKIAADQAAVLYHGFYDDHRHIFFTEGEISSYMVQGTDKTVISLQNDELGRLVVTAAFDPRFKASAGNIVHILNLLFGLDERTGL